MAQSSSSSSSSSSSHPLCELCNTFVWPQLPQSIVRGITLISPFAYPSTYKHGDRISSRRPTIGWVTSLAITKYNSATTVTFDLQDQLTAIGDKATIIRKVKRFETLGAVYRQSNSDGAPEISITEVNALPFIFDTFYRHHFECIIFDVKHIEAICDGIASPELIAQIARMDHIVIPSVLFFDRKRNSSEWFKLFLDKFDTPKVRIFPFIAIESQMENKEIYMQYLANAKQYIPYNWPINRHFIAFPSSSIAQSNIVQLTSPSKLSESTSINGPIGAPYAIHLTYHNSTFAPTVLLCTVNWKDLSPSKRDEITKWAMDRLSIEVKEANWPIELKRDGIHVVQTYIAKGCNSACLNACQRFYFKVGVDTDGGIRELCEEWYKDGSTTVPTDPTCRQDYVILQPCITSLQAEVRSYFVNGQHVISLKTIIDGVMSTSIIDRNTICPLTFDKQLQVSLPALIDQAIHVLSLLEAKNKLVSLSAMLRVDQGVEFIMVIDPLPVKHRSAMTDNEKQQIDTVEQQYIQGQKNPNQWTASGCGWVTRSYVNEVTTSLDIGIYAALTTAKLAFTFAAPTARLLLN